MNGINRLLTRREKDKSDKDKSDKSEKTNTQQQSKPTDRKALPKSSDSILPLFRFPYDGRVYDEKKADKEEGKKIQRILLRLRESKYENFDEAQVEFGLRTEYAAGNEDRAFDILVLFRQSIDGVVMPFDRNVKMLGAKNLGGVTCYLDSLLFAMFARLENFQPMLYTSFEDEPRRRLSTLIRIWVNMLRTGKVIHGDITKFLQQALLACGWKEACDARQQDTSEAFQFITEQLQLPLLTLKTDLFHVGDEDVTGDHKFVEERLLNVAVLPDREDGKIIQLEDCLEEYFNNRVEVRRILKRSNTHSSMATRRSQSEKASQLSQLHVTEILESGATTPDAKTECNSPTFTFPPATPTVIDNSEDQEPSSNPSNLERSSSIIKRTFSFDGSCTEMDMETETAETSKDSAHVRKNSRTRKEVQMPAWAMSSLIRLSPIPIYCYNLLPITNGQKPTHVLIGDTAFYTANKPMDNPITSNAQIASHLSSIRPVLGICLKRYAVLENGDCVRRDALVDIPLQIAFPHFIQQEDESMFGNFKICLQSVVCHRGTSVHSGHYITLIRGARQQDKQDNQDQTLDRQVSNSSSPPEYYEDPWFKFDDLAPERVTQVDIHEAMKEEMPYLLFYQIQPLLDETLPDIAEERPPSYTYSDSGIEMAFQDASPREEEARDPGYFDEPPQLIPNTNRVSFSDDADQHRRSLNLPEGAGTYSRRASVAVTEESLGGSRAPSFIASVPSATATPAEENPTATRAARRSDEENTTASRISRAASKFRSQHSRSASAVGENRLSFSFMRKKSKDELNQLNDRSSSVITLGVPNGTTEDLADYAHVEGIEIPSRKRSKKGKGKEKSKSSPEKDRSNGLLLAKFDKDGNERECVLM